MVVLLFIHHQRLRDILSLQRWSTWTSCRPVNHVSDSPYQQMHAQDFPQFVLPLVFRNFEHMLGYILHPPQIMPP